MKKKNCKNKIKNGKNIMITLKKHWMNMLNVPVLTVLVIKGKINLKNMVL
jgi:hypothetical protein